jgi:hypothetical protein
MVRAAEPQNSCLARRSVDSYLCYLAAVASGRVCDSDGHSNTYRAGDTAVFDAYTASHRYCEQHIDDDTYSIVLTNYDPDRHSADCDAHTEPHSLCHIIRNTKCAAGDDANPDTDAHANCYASNAESDPNRYACNPQGASVGSADTVATYAIGLTPRLSINRENTLSVAICIDMDYSREDWVVYSFLISQIRQKSHPASLVAQLDSNVAVLCWVQFVARHIVPAFIRFH